ncbi:hypothetical protein DSM43518_04194 [Mycobacterium marinum]|nr:hypothetical protein DSM43518_04194 [Mycobacterium marinum]
MFPRGTGLLLGRTQVVALGMAIIQEAARDDTV